MRCSLILLVALLPLACSTFANSPATRGALHDRLTGADTSRIEDATRACLTKGGWKVDPVGSLSGGANVVTAAKAKSDTSVYIQPPEVSPRITGGPDYDDPFWSCLGEELAKPSTAPPSEDETPSSDKP
jgi:hypothetical protein